MSNINKIVKVSSMYIAMNRFQVLPESEEAFRQRWLDREVLLTTVPGFVSFSLLRGPVKDDHILWSSHTIWSSKQAFRDWTQSEQFRKAHAGAGGNKPLTLGPPVFEGFEVVQHIDN